MAHLQGTDYVGSMVVLEDGLPNKREYRRFKVNTGAAATRSVPATTTRRWPRWCGAACRRISIERDRPINERGDKPGKFAYPPQLLLVDGGKGQLNAAKRVIDELELTDEIPVAGLAKRFEEVFVPGRQRTGGDPAGERGAVHAPAHP